MKGELGVMTTLGASTELISSPAPGDILDKYPRFKEDKLGMNMVSMIELLSVDIFQE